MAIDILASSDAFAAAAEQSVMHDVFRAFLAAIDATDDERVAARIGVALHIIPCQRMHMGGNIGACVRIDVVLPAIALASFRRRRRFIADATAAVVAHATDPTIAERVVIRIVHSVDGGWGVGGQAFTNDDIDEGPE